jgi:Flp pilus assembly protein TadD
MDREQPESALPYLRRLVTIAPGDPSARFNLALAAYRAGRSEEAITHFTAFKELAPEAPQIPEVDRLLGTFPGTPEKAPATTP